MNIDLITVGPGPAIKAEIAGAAWVGRAPATKMAADQLPFDTYKGSAQRFEARLVANHALSVVSAGVPRRAGDRRALLAGLS